MRPASNGRRVLQASIAGLMVLAAVVSCSPGGPSEAPAGTPTNAPATVREETSATTPTSTPTASPTAAHGVFRTIDAPGPGQGPALTLCDGRVLIVQGGLEPAVVYDPQANRFSLTGRPIRALTYTALYLLPDCRALLVGSGAASAEAEYFDPTAGLFADAGVSASLRNEASLAMLDNGTVLFVGGVDGTGKVLASAELYDPATRRFRRTGVMSSPRAGAVLTPLMGGRVLVTGGQALPYSDAPGLASAEIYDLLTGKFSATGAMSVERLGHAAVRLTDGRVLVLGGQSTAGQTLASAELYDPGTGQFKPAGATSVPRIGETATVLRGGQVLVAGGVDPSSLTSTDLSYLSSAEIFDPISGTFRPTGSLNVGRAFSSAVILSDGRILVVSGEAAKGVPWSLISEIYVP